ncbi:MAG: DUF11 domain-containing protein [Lachnospiraceae bacterium]|nr:DUF11 domain-containing protein [Lachnospiraceae bacterium]
MKKLKRAACILLALVMTLSMTVTAFADDDGSTTGSITITNATMEETYSIYKLFDATIGTADEDGNIPTAYVATAAQKEALEEEEDNVFAFTALSDGTYQVTLKDGVSDEDVVAFINSYFRTLSGGVVVCNFPGATLIDSKEAESSTVTFSNLALGYYYVTSSLGSVASLDTANPNATIVDKNLSEPDWDNNPEEPVPDDPVKDVLNEEQTRSINKEEVAVDDVLTYSISYTNTSGEVLDEVIVYDQAPDGTVYANYIAIQILDANGNDVTANLTTATNDTAEDGILTWTVENLPDAYTVVATFQVTVTEDAYTLENWTIVNEADLKVTLGENEYWLKTNEVENPLDEEGKPVKDVKDGTDGVDVTSGSIDGEKVEIGQTLTYTITYTNTEDAAVDLTITDAPPAGTTYAGNAGSTLADITTTTVGEDGTITWVVKGLEVGATVTVYFQVTVNAEALELVESTIPNSAEYTFDGENTYNTNTVKNPTEDEPEEPEDEDFGKVIIEKDGTETKVSTGAFGDTVTFDVSIDAVNLVENEIQDDNLYNDQVAYYYIYDQMDPGFDLNDGSFTLTINGRTIDVTCDKTLDNGVKYYTIDDGTGESYLFTYVNETTGGYTIIEAKIAWADPATGNGLYPDCEVHLTYTATINEDAVIAGDGNLNRAIYDYSVVGDNDPEDPPYEPDPEKPTYPDGSDLNHDVSEITTVTYTYALGVYKTSEETGEALEGAEFTLVDAGENAIYAVPVTDDNGAVLYYNYTSDSDAEGATSTFTSNASGQILIKGVDIGTYTLTEVKAPDGYVLLTDPVTLEAQMDSSSETYNKKTLTTTRYFAAITAEEFDEYEGSVYTKGEDGTFTEMEKPGTYSEDETLYKLVRTESESEESENVVVTEFEVAVASILVINAAGSTLPSTGGMGTTLFYLVGGILVLGAAVLLITRRRMSRN